MTQVILVVGINLSIQIILISESNPGDCTFDQSQPIASCQWQQLNDDDFDWSSGSSTPTDDTGPTSDRSGSGECLGVMYSLFQFVGPIT